MAFNVDEFRSYVGERGVIQTNKYDVVIAFPWNNGGSLLNYQVQSPDGSSVSFGDMTADLQYRCINATLPGVTLRTADINRYGLGVVEKMPYTGSYTDISLTFLCDRYGDVYNFWYAWFNYIFAVNGNVSKGTVSQIDSSRAFYTAEYKDNYAGLIDITVYDNAGYDAINYTLYKAFPIAINDTPVSWGDNNNLLKLTTTITFKEWSFANVNLVNNIS
jgi:hypothetical protein